MLGFPPDELVGRQFECLLPHDRRQLHRKHREEYAGERRPRAMDRGLEIDGLHRDGHKIPLTISLAPLPREDPPMVLALIRDQTETRRVSQDLRHAQRIGALGRLTTGIAHDFNNLLTVISGSAGALVETLHPSHPGRDDAEMILEAGRRAASLAHHLLLLARRGEHNVGAVDLNDIVLKLTSTLSRVLGDAIDIRSETHPALPAVMANADELGQVILNMAINARDAMPHGGRLTVVTGLISLDAGATASAKGERSAVTLTIRDTGVGMDAAVQAQIFNSFFTTKPEGTGLGLATTKEIVERYGGTIRVWSTPGEGTEFRITLPTSATSVPLAAS